MAEETGSEPPAPTNERASWATAFGFTVLGQGMQGAARLGCLVLVGRYAGKVVLGEVTALLAVGTFLVLAWPQPAGAAASRYMSLASRDVTKQDAIAAFGSRTVLLASPLLALLGATIATVWLGGGNALLVWAALLPVFLGMAVYVRGVRNGRLHFKQSFLWDACGAAVTIVVVAVVLWLGAVEYVLAAFCLGYAVSALPGWPMRRADKSPPVERGSIARYAAWTAIQVLTAGGLIHITMALTAWRATPSQLGDMGAAVSIATPALLLAIALRTSAVPFATRRVARGDYAGLRTASDGLLRAMVAVVIPVYGATCIWSAHLLELLYSDEFVSASTVLVILLLGVSFNCLNASHIWLTSGPSWGARALAMCNGSGLCLGLIVGIAATIAAPVTGAAIGYMVGSLVSCWSATFVVWKHAGMNWAALFIRLVLGYTLILASVLASQDAEGPMRFAITIVFLLLCVGLSLPDLGRVRRDGPWALQSTV